MNNDFDALLARHRELVARHLIAENAHQMEETLATLHPDCLFEDVTLGLEYRGREGAGEYYRTWWNAFSIEVRGIARHWTTEGNMIAETRYVGTHTGNFFGVPATGRNLDLRLAVVIRFQDGLMLGERFYYDLASLLSQLGVTHLPALQ
jgi:steroid delta-isomerase-like uncharacterized protein